MGALVNTKGDARQLSLWEEGIVDFPETGTDWLEESGGERMMIDEGGQLSRIGNSSVSSDGKIGGLFFAGPTRSVISEALDRPTPGGVGFFAGMSCSTCGGDCATMVALRARVDPAETEPRREREGVFGMGSPAGAGSLPVFVDFLGDAGVSVNSCVESKLPIFLQCLDGSRRSRVLIRRSLGMLWEALE